MRIAVLDRERCQPKKCNHECITYCPKVRAGVPETIYAGEDGKPLISETLCIGCGICVHKCPFDAIQIINLPDEMGKNLVHQYGLNTFRIYGLPIVRPGTVVGLLGPNGIGKTTALKLLSGEVQPNLGRYEDPPDWDAVLDHFRGTGAWDHLKRLADGKAKVVVKPQYVDLLPRVVKGVTKDLLQKVDERDQMRELVSELQIEHTLDRPLDKLSGGELQRVAVAAALLREADLYFLDEPSSYLDVQQRLSVARVIRQVADSGKGMLVVEHDLAVLDSLAEQVHVMYGKEGAYGVIALPRGARVAINAYLDGFLPEENVRIRDEKIAFTVHPPRVAHDRPAIATFQGLVKKFPGFQLTSADGTVREGEVVGVVGPNATGKTTFVRLLAGELEADAGTVDVAVKVSHKPQHVRLDVEGTVNDLLVMELRPEDRDAFFQHEVVTPLGIGDVMTREVSKLSGGELQRVAIALSLGRHADLYLLDEPSAYLDVNQRMKVAKAVRRIMEKRGSTALVVDHDVYFIDLVADALLTFEGTPGREGHAVGPLDLRAGMNRFLKDIQVTFRRDPDTGRPRINKPGSGRDREQRAKGEYYYESRDATAEDET